MIHIGHNIKSLLKEKKSNAPELAKAIGKTKQSVYGYLEKPDIDTKVLRQIADFFYVPLSYFFAEKSESENMQNNTSQEGNIDLSSDNKVMKALFKTVNTELMFFRELNASVIENMTELFIKIVDKDPEMKAFMSRQKEVKRFIAQLNTLITLKERIFYNEHFFEYFENPYKNIS